MLRKKYMLLVTTEGEPIEEEVITGGHTMDDASDTFDQASGTWDGES